MSYHALTAQRLPLKVFKTERYAGLRNDWRSVKTDGSEASRSPERQELIRLKFEMSIEIRQVDLARQIGVSGDG
jgi:hypothetical protein